MSTTPAAFLRLAVHSLPVFVFAVDVKGTVLVSEGEVFRVSDRDREGAVRAAPFDFLGVPEVQNHLRRALEGEEHDADIRVGEGARTLWARFVPCPDEAGKVGAVVGLALDVTEARRARTA